MPKIEIKKDSTIEFQDETSSHKARIEIKTANELLGLYEAVIIEQKDGDGKTFSLVVFKKILIMKGSPLESTY